MSEASPDLASALLEHGRILEALDRLEEAEGLLDRALSILRPLVDAPDAGADAAVLDELTRLAIRAEGARASAVRSRGRLAEAEAGCRRALALAEARLPPGDFLIGEALNGLGVVHKFQGRFDEAEPLYRRALAMAEAAGQISDQATLLHNLAGLAHARGDFAAGEPVARRSVELREGLLGPDHPAVAADRAAWGALLEGLGRLPEAERAYAEALRVFEASLGPESLEAASALTALGGVAHAQGRLDDALACTRRALAIREAALPPDHFDLGITLNNLAMLLDDRGERQEARAHLFRAIRIFEAALGPDHPHTRAAKANAASLARG